MQQLSFFGREAVIPNIPENLLVYHDSFFDPQQSRYFFDHLVNSTQWSQTNSVMYGKTLKTPRLTAWFGNPDSVYQFSGTKHEPYPWTIDLLAIRKRVESASGISFNSVLLNYYRDGNDSVAWHSDNEPELRRSPVIASVSLGQPRRFDIRSKADYGLKHSVVLENGSLLLMKAELQQLWEHRVPKSTKPLGPRINLTFRVVSRTAGGQDANTRVKR